MDRNGIAVALLLISILADVSDASFFSKLRILVEEASNPNSTTSTPSNVSPFQSPIVGTKKSDRESHGSENLMPKASNSSASTAPPPPHVEEKGKIPKQSNEKESRTTGEQADSGSDTSDADGSMNEKDLKDLDSTRSLGPSPRGGQGGKNKGTGEEGMEKQNNEDEKKLHLGTGESCEGVPGKCKGQNSLMACIKNSETGSKELVVQNEGEGTLSVDIRVPTMVEYSWKKLTIQKHEIRKVRISDIVIKSSKLILSAGKGECVLHMDPVISEGNFFVHLPSYNNLVTPINGAYFLIATVVICGGTWACCKFRTRRRQNGIPYQELEMAMPESISTAEGWDQVWDDDWDEESAVKSPAIRHAGNISANGLTARSSNKGGWENDWDD